MRKILLISISLGLLFVILMELSFKNKKPEIKPEIPDISGGTELNLPPMIEDPDFIVVEKVSNRINEDSLYADIINHSKSPHLQHDRDTNAHETTHSINSVLRNSQGYGYNGFYLTKDKGFIIKEPSIRKRDLIKYIPVNLRSYRYPTYITGQTVWDDQPLYVFDEWVSYVNGAAVSVEDVETGRHSGSWSDAVSGCLGFSIYSTALAMAVAEKDPDYWQNNVQFKRFINWHLKRSFDIFQKGRYMTEFRWDKQERLYSNLLKDPAAEPMRKFIQDNFDGVWLEGETSSSYGPIPEFKDFYGAVKIIKVNGREVGVRYR